MIDEPKKLTEDDLYRKVFFPRQHGLKDIFRMRGKAMRYLMLGTIIVGQLTMNLWYKEERLEGGQRRYTYIERVDKGKKLTPEILAVGVYFGSGGTYNRDQYLPGWNTGDNTVDCIGGGGGGGGGGYDSGSGGGGGGLARYTNVGALGPTFSMSIGGPGGGGGNRGNGAAGGNTQLDGWVGAYGGGAGLQGGGGGGGGTYYAGTGYYPGGNGGAIGVQSMDSAGGGGGAAGRWGGGSSAYGSTGGNGGPSGGGGGAGQGGVGGNGAEWQAGIGSGGGGGGGMYANGSSGGYYGAGGGGGGWANGNVGGPGTQGLLCIVYNPLQAPVINSISPNAGPTAGGQAVAIYGSGFYNIASVNIGGAPVTGISYNAGAIYGTTSAGGAGTYNVNVNVTGGVGAGVGYSLYTYANPPAASGSSPNLGLTLGGTLITITGSYFSGISSVTVGGVAATSVNVINANTITCITPPHAAGLVNITVNGQYGSTNLLNAFTYLLPASGFNMPMLGF
jgi:hypothetical protein